MREAIRYIKNNLKAPLIGAEIGVAQGTHALEVLQNLDCKLYLVDIWHDYMERQKLDEVAQLSKAVFTPEMVSKKLRGYNFVIIKGSSIEIAKAFPEEFFDFVYIDGNHSYEAVKDDIIAWRPTVKKGGVLCGHDYTPEWEGVVKAVDELVPNRISTEKVRYPDWYEVIK